MVSNFLNIIQINSSISDAINGLINLYPDVWTMMATLIAAVFMTILIKKVVWNPVMKYMDERANLVKSDLDEAEAKRVHSVELEEKAKALLEKAEKDAKELLDTTKAQANNERFTVVEKTRKETKKIIEDAYREIDSAKRDYAKNVKGEIIDVAFEAAEKIVEKNIDKSEKDLVEDFVSKLDESN